MRVTVFFSDNVRDDLLKFAVIAAKYQGKWVFCKHKERNTLECPGGHREPGERIEETAKRELWEETGANVFHLEAIGPYGVEQDGSVTYGMLYAAWITELGPLPQMEIERIELVADFPQNWTYPLIQPKLLEQAKHFFADRKKDKSQR